MGRIKFPGLIFFAGRLNLVIADVTCFARFKHLNSRTYVESWLTDTSSDILTCRLVDRASVDSKITLGVSCVLTLIFSALKPLEAPHYVGNFNTCLEH